MRISSEIGNKSFLSVNFFSRNQMTQLSVKEKSLSKSFLKLLASSQSEILPKRETHDTHNKITHSLNISVHKNDKPEKNDPLSACPEHMSNLMTDGPSELVEEKFNTERISKNNTIKCGDGKIKAEKKPSLFKRSKTLFHHPQQPIMNVLPIIAENDQLDITKEIQQFDSALRKKVRGMRRTENIEITSTNSGKKWRKLSIIIRSVSLLNHHHAKALLNEIDVEKEVNDFKEWKLKVSQTIVSTPRNDVVNNEEPASKELLKLSLKEKFYRLIMEGGHTNLNYLNDLWERNPERYARDPHDDKFLFNQPMSNGQTLMYISAKEGNLHMLSYLLSKNLNAKIKSKIDDRTEESCLQVASRWNYLKVVELLLSHVDYERKDIQEALCNTELNEKIVRVLLDYYTNKFEPQRKEEKVLCFC